MTVAPSPVSSPALARWPRTIASLVAEQLQIQLRAHGTYTHAQREQWFAIDWQLFLRGF